LDRSRLATSLVALPIIALLVALGTWQLQRLAWKEDIIATMDARLAQAPVPLAEALTRPPAEREWQRVMATGTYLHDRQVAMYRMSVDGEPGYLILTPLRLADGRTILVNRGFVPPGLVEPELRPGSEPDGEVWVVGVLRGGETQLTFTNDNDPATGAWYWYDLPALGTAMGTDLLPGVIHADRDPAATWPVGGQAIFSPRNDHLQYALTWYGLAGVALVIYVLLLAKRPARRPQP
jgi:surfeit locus 1 family protein